MKSTNRYLANVKFLLIEPNAFMRSIIKNVLLVYGCNNFVEANNAEEGFKAVLQTNPDIVMTEYGLTPFDGFELIRRIRDDSQCPIPFVPIIMMTGYTDMDRVRAARDAGVTEFLAKPISAKTMMRHVAEVIEHPRPFVRVGDYFGPDRRRRRRGGETPVDERRRAAPIEPQRKEGGLTQRQIDQLIAGQEIQVKIPSAKEKLTGVPDPEEDGDPEDGGFPDLEGMED